MRNISRLVVTGILLHALAHGTSARTAIDTLRALNESYRTYYGKYCEERSKAAPDRSLLRFFYWKYKAGRLRYQSFLDAHPEVRVREHYPMVADTALLPDPTIVPTPTPTFTTHDIDLGDDGGGDAGGGGVIDDGGGGDAGSEDDSALTPTPTSLPSDFTATPTTTPTPTATTTPTPTTTTTPTPTPTEDYTVPTDPGEPADPGGGGEDLNLGT